MSNQDRPIVARLKITEDVEAPEVGAVVWLSLAGNAITGQSGTATAYRVERVEDGTIHLSHASPSEVAAAPRPS